MFACLLNCNTRRNCLLVVKKKIRKRQTRKGKERHKMSSCLTTVHVSLTWQQQQQQQQQQPFTAQNRAAKVARRVFYLRAAFEVKQKENMNWEKRKDCIAPRRVIKTGSTLPELKSALKRSLCVYILLFPLRRRWSFKKKGVGVRQGNEEQQKASRKQINQGIPTDFAWKI